MCKFLRVNAALDGVALIDDIKGASPALTHVTRTAVCDGSALFGTGAFRAVSAGETSAHRENAVDEFMCGGAITESGRIRVAGRKSLDNQCTMMLLKFSLLVYFEYHSVFTRTRQ